MEKKVMKQSPRDLDFHNQVVVDKFSVSLILKSLSQFLNRMQGERFFKVKRRKLRLLQNC
jgi:hypothetical protein